MKAVGLIILLLSISLAGCGGAKKDSLPVIYNVENVNIATSSSNKVSGQLADVNGKIEGFEFRLIDAPEKGIITFSADGSFTYVPNGAESNGDQFTYSLRDANGQSNVATVTIEITIVSACLTTRETLLSKEFLLDENSSAVITTLGENQEVAGFVVELDAYNFNTTARDMLISIISRIDSQVSTVSTISERKALSTVDSITGQYKLTYSLSDENVSTTELNNTLYIKISDDVMTQLPEVSGEASQANKYRLWITVIYNDPSSVMVVVALVSEENYANYASILDAYADGGNIALCGSDISSNKDKFVADQAGSNLADFLFVVDNSGSMSNEQIAVKEAANIFSNTIEDAGLNYEIGVITTDNDTLRGSGFTADIDLFKIDIVAGIRGSGTETGIFYAENALRSTDLGDDFDGTVTDVEYPRVDASMSVIIISDEPSQYLSRGRPAFDTDDNLFIDRNYRVYSIIDEGDASRSQYDDLAFSSGGAIASISDTSTFPAIMEQIATSAGGASSSYVLASKPVSSTISVSVDGVKIIRSKNDGWRYIALSNSIVFYGDAIPTAKANIVVEYSTITESSLTTSGGAIMNTGEMSLLAKSSGCTACHEIDKKIVGPSWGDVALRYSSDSETVRSTLIDKVKRGGKGNWTELTKGVPMPPYSPRVKDEDIEALVDFILSLDN